MQCILLVLLSLCFFNCISLVSLHRRKEQTTKAFDNVFKFIFKWIFSNAFVLFVVPSMTRQFVCLFLTISPPSVYLAALLFGAVGKLCPTFRLNKITFFFFFFDIYIYIYICMQCTPPSFSHHRDHSSARRRKQKGKMFFEAYMRQPDIKIHFCGILFWFFMSRKNKKKKKTQEKE